MKNLLMLVGIIMLLGVSKAQAGDPDFIRSSATVHFPISISNAVATQVDAPAVLLTGRFILVIDIEGADDMRCGFNAGVTQTTNGFLIRAGAPFVIKLRDLIPVFCITIGAAPQNVSLLQGKSI